MTPETESKVKDLMEGYDITHQRCTDCGFKGTKKRVKIHCMHHYGKYMCECMLLKPVVTLSMIIRFPRAGERSTGEQTG